MQLSCRIFGILKKEMLRALNFIPKCVKPLKKKTTKCRDGQNEFTLLVKRAVCCISPSAQLNWTVQHQYGSGFRLGALVRHSGRKLC